MENKIVVANLKMNKTNLEIEKYSKQINEKIKTKNVVICPTSIYVSYFIGNEYSVGLQNVFHEEKGAFTGEVSPVQASSIGITHTILGHSERRINFNETNDIINKKLLSVLKNDMKAILCIGETSDEKKLCKTKSVLQEQLKNCLKNVNSNDLKNIYIAYEPVWAIGTDTAAFNEDIKQITEFIKNEIYNMYKFENAKVLYGGSVTDLNIEKINQISNLDGFLVGGSSLDVNKFLKIIEVVVNR